MAHPRVSGVALWSAAVAALFLATCPAHGKTVVRGIRGPFSSFAREGAWVQRDVVVVNEEDRPQALRVEHVEDDPRQGPVRYVRSVLVPARMQRIATLPYRLGTLVPLREPESPGGRQLVPVQQDYRLWDEQTGEQVFQEGFLATKIEPEVTIAAVIGGDDADYEVTSYLMELTGGAPAPIQLARLTIEQMPDRWYGYGLADIVLVASIDPGNLRASQLQALLDWVRRGGVMVICGGRRIESMLAGPLGREAGTSAIGLHFVGELAARGKNLDGSPVPLRTAVPLAELDCQHAEVLYEAGGLPLLTHRQAGAGHVFTLATSAGGLEPQPLHVVWHRIADIVKAAPPFDVDGFAAAAKATLQQTAGRRGPARSVPVGLLIAMVLALSLTGIVLRLRRRGELLWLALIPGAIVLAVGLHVYGKARSDPERLSYVGVIRGLAGGEARVAEVFAYYSGPDEQQMSFSAGDGRATIAEIGATRNIAAGVATIRAAAQMELADQRVRPNTVSAFEADAVKGVGGLEAAWTFDAVGLSGNVRNAMTADVQDAVVYVNGRTYGLGTLAAGAARQVHVAEADFLPGGEFSSQIIAPDPLRAELMNKLKVHPEFGRPVSGRPMLVGYASVSPLDPLSERGLIRQGWSVVLWPVEVSPPPPGSLVAIPAGFVQTDFQTVGTPVYNVKTAQFIPSPYESEVVVLASPPAGVGRLTGVSATILVGIDGSNYRMIVSGLDDYQTAQPPARTEIKAFSGPSGRLTIPVPDAERFLNSDGRFVFSLKIEAINRALPPAERGEWKIESVNVALKGTVR